MYNSLCYDLLHSPLILLIGLVTLSKLVCKRKMNHKTRFNKFLATILQVIIQSCLPWFLYEQVLYTFKCNLQNYEWILMDMQYGHFVCGVNVFVCFVFCPTIFQCWRFVKCNSCWLNCLCMYILSYHMRWTFNDNLHGLLAFFLAFTNSHIQVHEWLKYLP